VDKGKAVYQLIVHLLEKLRPEQDEPRGPIPREWHAYLVLHDAYVEDRLNRDIGNSNPSTNVKRNGIQHSLEG